MSFSSSDIRWKQRFQNFEKAILLLEESLQINNPSITEKAGTIQFFELSFELAWKVLKDFLENQGLSDLQYPRQIIKQAFQSNLITDGHIWLLALKDRNLTSHSYDEEFTNELVVTIKKDYFPHLKILYINLKNKI